MPPAAQQTAIERIAARYAKRFHAGYARGKLRHDPVFEAAVDWIGASAMPLLDIGCGLGLLGQYLREHGWHGAYHGIDLDTAKVAAARAAAPQWRDFRCEIGNAAALPPFQGHVALIDVLHYLPQAAQQQLLRAVATRVAPGASLLIRNVLRAPGWRFRVTQAEEWLIRSVRWMRAPVSHYPTRAELEQPLLAAGFRVDVMPLWQGTPFNSYALLAHRPRPAAAAAGTGSGTIG